MIYQVTSAEIGKDEDGENIIIVHGESTLETADAILYPTDFIDFYELSESYGERQLDLGELLKNPRKFAIGGDEDEVYLFKPSGS